MNYGQTRVYCVSLSYIKADGERSFSYYEVPADSEYEAIQKGHSWMKCSNCLHLHEWQTAIFNYCPICGARMSEDIEYGYN